MKDESCAPGFILPDIHGVRHSLDDYLATAPLLLAFHRGIW